MTVRALKYLDCPNCGEDTMHNGTCCMTCGNVQVRPGAAWQAFRHDHLEAVRRANNTHARARRAAMKTYPAFTDRLANNGLKKGRERFKV